MQNPFTVQDVLAAAQAVATAHPDRRNPLLLSESIYCAYTHPDDPDWHCFAGSILVELGCALPNETVGVNLTSDRDRFEWSAMALLRDMQAYADTRPRDDCDDIVRDSLPLYTFAEVYQHFADQAVTP